MAARIGITGCGHALPATIRRNDDPLFDWLKQNDPDYAKSFYGYDERHVLAPGESILGCMLGSAQAALEAAALAPQEVDLLLGYVSVSDYAMPNGLAPLHQQLGLPERCWILPLNNEYSNFNAGLVLADAMIRTGQVRNALIACGGNWSRFVDYHSGAAASAADGAGAAVLSRTDDAATWRVVDWETVTQTAGAYGNMAMGSDPAGQGVPDQGLLDSRLFTQPYFHLTSDGMKEFGSFGVHAPVQVVKRLLERNALPAGQVSITAHQTSRFLLDSWNQALQPRVFYDSLKLNANMTLASLPVNLSQGHAAFTTDHLVLVGIGPELHANALLLQRNG